MARSEAIRGTRRSTLMRRGDGIGAFERLVLWCKRIGFAVLLCVALFFAGLWFLLTEGDNYFQKKISEKFQTVTAQMGYRVKDIMVEGRTYTDAKNVLDLIGVKSGDPLFRVDPSDVKADLEHISWVKSAHVERRLPNTVYVRLVERRPYALWKQKDGDLAVIDRDGAVLTENNLKAYKNLLMVSGIGAAAKAKELLDLIEAEPEIKSRMDQAILVENRRWDLVLKGGKIIKLPEKDIGLALSALAANHKRDGVLDKPLAGIDVRDPARLIVRAEVGKANVLSAAMEHKGGQDL